MKSNKKPETVDWAQSLWAIKATWRPVDVEPLKTKVTVDCDNRDFLGDLKLRLVFVVIFVSFCLFKGT